MEFADYPNESIMNIIDRPEIIFVKGEGSTLIDHTGHAYCDWIQGWAVNTLGHCDAGIIRTLHHQAQKLINPSPAFYNLPMGQLAELLTQKSHFDRVFFANSGAEANEGAIKLARKWGQIKKNGAYKIITFQDAFHGRTLATMSASGKAGWDTMFKPQVSGFSKAKLNDLSSVKALLDDETVAVMLEPIQGEGGVVPADLFFLQQLRELTLKKQVLLIVDEVQTGCGRTGYLFAHQAAEIKPDIMTLGKGIGGGIPLAALLATENTSLFEYGEQGGTYNGNPLMTAVGYEIISRISHPHFLKNVQNLGQILSEQLKNLSDKFNLLGERGVGLLRALLLPNDTAFQIANIARYLEPKGLLINAVRPNVLRFMPALNITEKDVCEMIHLLDTAIEQSMTK